MLISMLISYPICPGLFFQDKNLDLVMADWPELGVECDLHLGYSDNENLNLFFSFLGTSTAGDEGLLAAKGASIFHAWLPVVC